MISPKFRGRLWPRIFGLICVYWGVVYFFFEGHTDWKFGGMIGHGPYHQELGLLFLVIGIGLIYHSAKKVFSGNMFEDFEFVRSNQYRHAREGGHPVDNFHQSNI